MIKRLSVAEKIRVKMENKEEVRALNYARTSTLKDEQKDSCDNQVMMCELYCRRFPNVHIVEPPFVDKGISGKSNINRNAYLELINRVKQGDIDLVIVKTKARLCRSKAIAAFWDELMQDYSFSILTLSDGQIYDSSDRSCRLINGIKDVMDEDYVWGQSEYGKMTHQLRCERKVLTNSNVVFGYRWNVEKRDIEINPEEAEFVKKMFEWYVFEDLGVSAIAKRLGDMGIYGKYSNKYITPATMNKWISNESYIGNFYINKRGSDLELGNDRTTKRYQNPKEEWILVERPDLRIISNELFELAQKCHQTRITIYDKPSEKALQSRFKGFHTFAGKVKCGECGRSFVFQYADRKSSIGVYKDYFSKSAKAPGETCENDTNKVYEDFLCDISRMSINGLMENREEVFENVRNAVKEAYEELVIDASKPTVYEKTLGKLEREKTSYFEGWRTAPDEEMKAYFYEKVQAIKKEIEELKKQVNAQKSIGADMHSFLKALEKVDKRIEELKHIKVVDRTIVNTFIEQIIVKKNKQIEVLLKVGERVEFPIEDNKPHRNDGAESIYPENITLFNNVGKLFLEGMTEVSRPGTPTRARIC